VSESECAAKDGRICWLIGPKAQNAKESRRSNKGEERSWELPRGGAPDTSYDAFSMRLGELHSVFRTCDPSATFAFFPPTLPFTCGPSAIKQTHF